MSMLVNEFDETDLVGKSAYPLYKKINASVEVTSRSSKRGVVKYPLGEAYVRRLGNRSWEIKAGGHTFAVDTQWALWAWFADRV